MQISPLLQSFIVSSGRSWWALTYQDDSWKYEWQEHPGGARILLPDSAKSSISEWENTDKSGVVGAMLLCPNGQAGGFREPPEGRLFQFKVGHASINAPDLWCDAHILGVVLDADGNCDFLSWEPRNQRLRLEKDNVYDFKYMNIGKLATDTSLQLKL